GDVLWLEAVVDRRAAVEAHHDRCDAERDQDDGRDHSSDLECLSHDSPSVASGLFFFLDFSRSLRRLACLAIRAFRDVRAGFSVTRAAAYQPGMPRRSAPTTDQRPTTPTSRASSGTGRWWKPPSIISRAASSMGRSGVVVAGASVIHSRTLPSLGCTRSATARTMSREVRIPVSRPYSTTSAGRASAA